MSAETRTLPAEAPRKEAQGGPPPGVLAVVFTGLFLAGLVLGTVLADGAPFPSPFGGTGEIVAYFRAHSGAVRVSGALQFAASIPLAVYAATVSARLHRLGVRAPARPSPWPAASSPPDSWPAAAWSAGPCPVRRCSTSRRSSGPSSTWPSPPAVRATW
ncbi:hypothetical protein O1L60_19305 [Streptomyces diastatochromogenes]|nr:hypothetical protein [Streptomyces diastatochromogenes]